MPVDDTVVATEEACEKLKDKAGSLRAKVAKTAKVPHSKITHEEKKALQELRTDRTIKILLADKAKTMVILNTADYELKLKTILSNRAMYEVLKKDPTLRYKNKMLKILRTWKREGAISATVCDKIYLTSEEVPKFYGLPKIHKKGTPLRPIVSSLGSIMHPAAKYLAFIINSLLGKTQHAIKRTARTLLKRSSTSKCLR